MTPYHDGRVRRLDENLRKARIPQESIAEIMRGGDQILRDATPAAKAEWLCGAMERLDRLVDPETRQKIREGCACCLGGKREKISKGIAREHATLEARIGAANEARFVFGHSVTKLDDGRIRVQFAEEGRAPYGCPCMPKAQRPMPVTYCQCCGGHVKHHLQNATGLKLDCEVVTTALSSGWQNPCTFLFTIVD